MAKKKKKKLKSNHDKIRGIFVILFLGCLAAACIYKNTPKDTPEYYWHPKEETIYVTPTKKAEKPADELNKEWYQNHIFE